MLLQLPAGVAAAEQGQTSSADGVRWNLADLYQGPNDQSIEHDLTQALRRAQDFEKAYRGEIGTPTGPTPQV